MTHSFVRSWREWLLALPILGIPLLFLATSTPIFVLLNQNHLAERTLSRDIRTIEGLGFDATSLNRPVHAAFFSLLAKGGVPPEIHILGITESMVIKDSERFFSVAAKLHHQGIRTSIDDFGTGATVLSYLTSYPIAEVKIDRSLVTNILSDLKRSGLLRTIIGLGRRLDFTTAAEGVESQEEWSYLEKHQRDRIQVFFASRPLPPKELEALFKKLFTHPEGLSPSWIDD